MKKISLLILSCLSSFAFSMSPPQNDKIQDIPSQEKSYPSIVSSENFFISKSYDENNVPKDLKQWLPWVNKDKLMNNCIDQHCVFIPKLTLSQNNIYKISIEGTSLVKNAWVPLPSSDKIWPLNVSINGQKTIIVKHNEKPFIQVPDKDFKIDIDYSSSLFDKNSTFNLPFNIVSFNNLTNKNIILKDTVLSLNDISIQDVNNNFQEIKVYRKFTDSIPYFLNTKIIINYSGKTKDLDLGTVLPENFKLSELNSDLKITFKNNHYYATINSGSHFINFSSFSNSPVDTISVLGLVNESENEIWSIQKNNNIRNMDVSNVSIVDSQQVNVPQEWTKLPSYFVKDKLIITTSQQGMSFNTNLKVNAQRNSFFGFNDKVYSFDNINVENNNSKELKFNNIDLQSVYFNKPKMILKDGNNPYVLLNEQDNNGKIYFDSNLGEAIPSQLSDNYFVQSWNTFFTPRTELIWAKNATVSSYNFWFNSWNLYSLFSLSILIIAIYKMLGKETAFIALFSLISFYENNSVFWLLWLLLIISFAFNKYLPEKYTNFKNNFNYINLLGTSVTILFSFKFLFNEIFSILHPNLSQKVSFDIYYVFSFFLVSFLIWKFINAFLTKSKNSLTKKFIFGFILLFILIAINSMFSTMKSSIVGSRYNSLNSMDSNNQAYMSAPAPATMEPRELSNESSKMEMADKLIEVKKEAKIIKRDLVQEKTQIGHEILQVNNLHQYTIIPKNEQVDFIVAKPWLVNLYGLLQSAFLILLSYLLFIYNLILFRKGQLFKKLPLILQNNYFVSKIQSKINEA